jgi:V8-like Glu-specific endopeptidase
MHICSTLPGKGLKHLACTALALAIWHGQALAAPAPLPLPEARSTDYGQYVVQPNSRKQSATLMVREPGALHLQLLFNAIKLPKGAYVTITDDAGTSQIFSRRQELANPVMVDGESATIQVSSDGLRPASLRLKRVIYQPAPQPGKTRVLLGADNRRALECYAGTTFYTHSLPAAALSNGSGALIGRGQYLLTNAHVTPALPPGGGPAPINQIVRLGWFDASCDAAQALPKNRSIVLRTTQQWVRGEPASPSDFALVEVNKFDLEHSHALSVFGSLKISDAKEVLPGTEIYVPQYGNGGLQPTVLGEVTDDGSYARITGVNPDTLQLSHNSDTQSGSSGSPVIDRDTQRIIGVHWGGRSSGNSPTNLAANLALLQEHVTPLLGSLNKGVRGKGNFSGYNLGLAPYLTPSEDINVPAGMQLRSYTDLQLEHHGQYSMARLEMENSATQQIEQVPVHLSLEENGVRHDLSTASGNASKLRIEVQEDLASYAPQQLRGWLPLRLYNAQGVRAQNLIAALSFNRYDPFRSPFDGVNTVQMSMHINDAQQALTVKQKLEGRQYGYIASHGQQGPNAVENKPSGSYAKLAVPLRSASGQVQVVHLRGTRSTACSTRPMNASVGCQADQWSRLTLSYLPEDNPNLARGVYQGLLPLNALASGDSQDLLVDLKLIQQ